MKKKYYLSVFLFGILLLFSQGCGIPNKVTMHVMTPILHATNEAAYKIVDVDIAKYGIPGNLILTDGLIATDPNNADLLLIATQGYYGYGMSFVEDVDKIRCREIYLKAKEYGLRLLNLNKKFKKAPKKTILDYEKDSLFFDKEDVPALFWSAISWGGWIFMSLDNVRAISELGKPKALMQRALELDETYFYAGPHLFFGVMYSAVSKMLGGDPEKALMHFEKAIEITKGKFLLHKVLFAQYYARQIFDEELFISVLNEVLEAPDNLLPEANLMNKVAKNKARLLLTKIDDLF